jgi:chemotaxis protein methyltransferase CheR
VNSGTRQDIEPRHKRWLKQLDAVVNRRCGLTSLPDRLWLLKSRVEQRMNVLGIRDMGAYVNGLVEGAASFQEELPLLVESLRVGETGWFRHTRQLRDLARWAAEHFTSFRGSNMLRAWCAGCATGQEPYSLAMTLTDGMGFRVRCRPKILATDISEECIRTAQQGAIDPEAVDNFPKGYLKRFTRTEAGKRRVSEAVRKSCTFRTHNLMEIPYPGSFHLILCRNVLIYFSPEARRTVLDRLAEALLPDGVLVLGYSESIREQSPLLEPYRVGETVLWRLKSEAAKDSQRRPGKRRSRPPVSAEGVTNRHKSGVAQARPEVSSNPVLRLSGTYASGDMNRLAKELRRLVTDNPKGTVIVDLDAVEYLSDEAAVLFRRTAEHLAADHVRMVLVASRPGVFRWIERSHLVPSVEIANSVDAALNNDRSAKR